MSEKDKSFLPDTGLEHAVDLLRQTSKIQENLPDEFPNQGVGELETLNLLSPHVLGCAARLDSSNALAHMDPPTPWITWATTLWNARLNQNLLQPATAPFAIEAEKKVIDRIDHAMSMASKLAKALNKEDSISLWAMPKTGVTVFRPLTMNTEEMYRKLPEGMFSTCILDDEKWLRSVAANPLADIDEIISIIYEVIHGNDA